MMRMARHRHRHRCVRGRFGLSNGHCSAALEGQHRYREPQEQSEEQARHGSMVPQIKSSYQDTASHAPAGQLWKNRIDIVTKRHRFVKSVISCRKL
jgi:hypothetical protein